MTRSPTSMRSSSTSSTTGTWARSSRSRADSSAGLAPAMTKSAAPQSICTAAAPPSSTMSMMGGQSMGPVKSWHRARARVRSPRASIMTTSALSTSA